MQGVSDTFIPSAFLKEDFPDQISPRTKNETTEFFITRSNSTYNFCEIFCLFISASFQKNVKAAHKDRGLMVKKNVSDEIVDKEK